jgi:hypothetical protein
MKSKVRKPARSTIISLVGGAVRIAHGGAREAAAAQIAVLESSLKQAAHRIDVLIVWSLARFGANSRILP